MEESNQIKRAIELDKKSGKFEMDESGYTRFIPSDPELTAINRWLHEEITRALEDHAPIFAEAAENLEVYKAVKTAIPGSGQSLIPSPIARNPADQIIATTHNDVMRARPVVSVDPYFPSTYSVPVPAQINAPMMDPATGMPQMDPMSGGPMMQMQQVAVPVDKSAEEIALRFEQGLEFKNRERLNFEGYLHETIQDCVTVGLTWGKVCRERKRRSMLAPKIKKGALIDLSAKEEVSAYGGEEVKFFRVPIFNVIRPDITCDIDDLEWIAERTPKTPEDVLAGFHSDEYFLLKDDAEAAQASKAVSEAREPAQDRVEASTRNWTPQYRKPMCEVFEVWFYRYLKVVDPETGQKSVKRYSLMGDYHYGAKKLMSCFRNPYDHQRRIHVPFMQFLDGSCTVGIVKYHQQIGTSIMQAEIKNAFHANNMVYWWDPNETEVHTFFKDRTAIGPGDMVPGKEGEAWGLVRGGAQHESMLPLLQWVSGSGQEASNVSDYESGRTIPGRTPSSTVSQILEQGGQQGVLFKRLLSRQMSKLFRLYLETCRQFSPLGETVPVKDPETKALMMVPMRFPVGEVLDNFRISLTAADEALAKERQPEDMAVDLDLYQRHTQFVAQVVGPMMDPNLSPAQTEFFRKIAEGEQALYERILSLRRTDTDKFDLKKAVDAIAEEKAAIMAQMEEMEAMGAANQGPNGDGSVPGAGGPPPPVAPAGPGVEPAMAGGAMPPPEEGLQAL